ncbi:MAG: universal stress protein [Acidobacteriota bacterium]
MFKKILVATDFSKASRAGLAAAISLAERGAAKVAAIHVSAYSEYPYTSEALVAPTSSLQAYLKEKLEEFFPAKLYPDSDRNLVIGYPASEEILKYAEAGSFDLIVIGTHSRNVVGRFFLGSVAQRVAQDSRIPVMIVRDVEHSERRYQGFERVLTPTDFSKTSSRAYELGAQFANFLKTDFHYIHIIDMPAITDSMSLYPFFHFVIPPESAMDVNLTLQKELEGTRLVGNPKVATRVGNPVHEILAYAKEEKIDFIVMGTHGRKGLDRLLMGSVAAGVIARSPVPVITLSAAA